MDKRIEVMKVVGLLVNRFRTQAGLSREEFFRRTGYSAMTIADIETARHLNFRLSTLYSLCEAFNAVAKANTPEGGAPFHILPHEILEAAEYYATQLQDKADEHGLHAAPLKDLFSLFFKGVGLRNFISQVRPSLAYAEWRKERAEEAPVAEAAPAEEEVTADEP